MDGDKLIASNAQEGDRFGTSVSISLGLAAAGSPRSDVYGADAGVVYVLRQQGVRWIEDGMLSPMDPAASDLFGHATAVLGTTILASSVLDDDKGSSSGSAYVFSHDGSQWQQEAKLLASDGTPNDEFGYSVDLESNQAVVGAWRDDDLGTTSGSAYVFVREGTEWHEQTKLLPRDPGGGHKFGSAVAIDGDRALVGAPGHDGQGFLSGAAYVFLREGTTWTQEAKLISSGGGDLDQFGGAVSLDGSTALVSGAGSAHVFARSGTEWTHVHEFTGAGAPLQLEGDRAIVGKYWDDGNGIDTGVAFLFGKDVSGWIQQAELRGFDSTPNDQFGWAVGLSGDDLVVAAHEDDDAARAAGSVYFFRWIEDPIVTYCTSKVNSCGEMPAISASGLPSATASSGFVVRGSKARGNRLGLLLYSDQGRASVPFQGGLLCVAAPIRRTPPTVAVGAPSSCGGTFSIDMSAFAAGLLGGSPQSFLRVPGTVVTAQWWGRDTIASGSYLTDGIEYTLCN